jgi:hypothetical protein
VDVARGERQGQRTGAGTAHHGVLVLSHLQPSLLGGAAGHPLLPLILILLVERRRNKHARRHPYPLLLLRDVYNDIPFFFPAEEMNFNIWANYFDDLRLAPSCDNIVCFCFINILNFDL